MTDDQVAFVVAHEMAHHDLGHINVFAGWADKIASLPGAALFAKSFHVIEWQLYGPEKECEADRHALDLCLAAGYVGNRALELFDILEHHALDVRDLDIVFSPDTESDDAVDPDAGWLVKARTWIWQRSRGYLPIRDRREMLMKHLLVRTAKQTNEAEEDQRD
jgi:hypothetical protein